MGIGGGWVSGLVCFLRGCDFRTSFCALYIHIYIYTGQIIFSFRNLRVFKTAQNRGLYSVGCSGFSQEGAICLRRVPKYFKTF